MNQNTRNVAYNEEHYIQ